MKKFIKIIGLYLLFGILINVVASAFGLYKEFLNLGLLSTSQYILYSTLIFGLLWLPLCISALIPGLSSLVPIAKILIIVVIIIFIIVVVRILTKKNI